MEIKLTKTPFPHLAKNLAVFRESFAALNPAPGLLLSLAEENRNLTREVSAISLNDYLQQLPFAFQTSSS